MMTDSGFWCDNTKAVVIFRIFAATQDSLKAIPELNNHQTTDT